jgi:hypothetical protein
MLSHYLSLFLSLSVYLSNILYVLSLTFSQPISHLHNLTISLSLMANSCISPPFNFLFLSFTFSLYFDVSLTHERSYLHFHPFLMLDIFFSQSVITCKLYSSYFFVVKYILFTFSFVKTLLFRYIVVPSLAISFVLFLKRHYFFTFKFLSKVTNIIFCSNVC